jgi:carbonic anhydrase
MARRNVARVVAQILEESHTLRSLVQDGRIAIVGAMYDIATGDIQYLSDPQGNPAPAALASEALG